MRIGIAVVALATVLLTGCAASPSGGGDDSPPPPTGETATPSATTPPQALAFEMPTRCTGLLAPQTESAFEADGRDLLGGPDGKYGENYFEEPTPEERAGGITCVWGDEEAPASTVIVSVAPITTATRAGIVSTLIANGLVESTVEGGLTYARIGDDVSAPAELHVIRNDSWISVIEAIGGETRFQEAGELVDEVTKRVYIAE
jgi:hypothetical protein